MPPPGAGAASRIPGAPVPPQGLGPAARAFDPVPPPLPGRAPAPEYLPPVAGAGVGGAEGEPATQYFPPLQEPSASGPAGDGEATRYLPPVTPSSGVASDSAATQYLPPIPGGPPAGPPSDAASAATQFLPPVPGAPNAGPSAGEAATQYLPPVPGPSAAGSPAGEAATQYLPPVPGGPVGAGPDAASAATQFLPPVQGGAGNAAASGDSSAATQYLPPVAPGAAGAAGTGAPTPAQAAGDRSSPPAEFDTLFRQSAAAFRETPAQPGPAAAAAATPSGPAGPRVPAAAQAGRPGPGGPRVPGPPPGAAAGYAPPPAPAKPARSGRGRSVAVIGGVVAGCAVAGLATGAFFWGGGDDKDKGQEPQKAASVTTEPSAPATPDGTKSKKPKPADPAEGQAKALDALLQDSGSSRGAVVQAVDATRNCKDLGKSAGDLRDAAKDRNGLVDRLRKTPVDKLPGHGDLTAQLTKAWQSSASADTHYAAWADQVGGKHGCHKGHARPSKEAIAGDRASGEATAAKKRAADLWNPIAKKYGLPQRQWTQL
ncbi:hypothetical protein J7W19_19530 [Streptomyces mobaraensis NBRC 13819 = DSM 40847]|uniref:Uncharacterized protein n=1 Tax=Streptomyces mobaraensis (strain ATCC 29032 / DSM 40847 / JCM 4168 / NBRC 13819 / NCIMB 11159 / IPCR 16-22) TaxID=1223523 RepID=M3C6B8_STRM1|nr:hypothetical protein [Streptomyces mobaraensis]EME99495.1 hypothetical protein H340_16121 [Streptomyces mobaraensis NBRC 13819 = DSM 40847]QTT75271.1 hypothetical protein J7W19_19530 [Streptomyces mobaraensis NBRC 13819 = DSM 40847]